MALARTILAIAFFFLESLSASGQDGTRQFRFPKSNDEIVRYESVVDLPDNLLTAIHKNGCSLTDERLKELPVLAFRPMADARGYAVLATCQSVVPRSFMFWQVHPRRDPEPMWFAMPNLRDGPGFGVTRSPGFLEWSADTRTLTAIQTTDVCPRVVGRTSYRFIHGVERDLVPSWMLTKMEIKAEPTCETTDNWKAYWEAAPWPDLPTPTP